MYNDSIINKLSPVFKIISLFFVIIMSILSFSLADYIILVLLCLTILLYSGIEIRNFIRLVFEFKFLLFLLLFLSIFLKCNFFMKLLIIICYWLIISLTTSDVSLIYGMEKILVVLNKKTEISKLSFYLMLVVKFPLLYINEKGKRIKLKESLVVKVGKYIVNIFVNIQNTIFKMKRIHYNYNVRLYDYFYTRTYYSVAKWNSIATILIILYLIILILIIK